MKKVLIVFSMLSVLVSGQVWALCGVVQGDKIFLPSVWVVSESESRCYVGGEVHLTSAGGLVFIKYGATYDGAPESEERAQFLEMCRDMLMSWIVTPKLMVGCVVDEENRVYRLVGIKKVPDSGEVRLYMPSYYQITYYQEVTDPEQIAMIERAESIWSEYNYTGCYKQIKTRKFEIHNFCLGR